MIQKKWSYVIVGLLSICLMATGCSKGKNDKDKNKEIEGVTTANEGSVSFSKSSGVYDEEFSLELNASGKIYYTLDGSNPSESDTRQEYKEAIKITDRSKDKNVLSAIDPVLFDAANARWDSEKEKYVSNVAAPKDDEVDKITVVKAVEEISDGKYSKVQTNTYFVGKMTEHIKGIEESCKEADMALVVMSISMDEKDLFDEEQGIYVKGKKFEEALAKHLESGTMNEWEATETGRKLDANYKQRGKEGERKAHVDYFESDGKTTECKLQQDCGIRIQGNYSRSDLQKGLRLCADTDYGPNDFEYAFFGEDAKTSQGEVITKFKKLTLRNGGNCAFTTKFSDTYWQSLIKDMKVETQASRPCVVYLNGEYWGLYILQEDYNDNYFQEKYDVDDKDVVAYKGDAETYEIGYKLDEGELPAGEEVSYYFEDLLKFYETHKDLKSQEAYNEFAKLVDVESVRDYFAIQIWVNNKWDWPGKNWTAWKVTKKNADNPYADGRWRLCCYDMDFGGVSGVSDASTNTIKEDNYKPNGLLDMDTENPVVLMYAYLMTNEDFRNDFLETLQGLSKNNFEKKSAIDACTKFKNIYEPLYEQFFTRYYGKDKAESSISNAVDGGYASYACIVDFLEEREKHIQTMVDWVNDFYS